MTPTSTVKNPPLAQGDVTNPIPHDILLQDAGCEGSAERSCLQGTMQGACGTSFALHLRDTQLLSVAVDEACVINVIWEGGRLVSQSKFYKTD